MEQFIVVKTGLYDITEAVGATSRDRYQCKVTIHHSSDAQDVYNGPIIILNKLGKIVPM